MREREERRLVARKGRRGGLVVYVVTEAVDRSVLV